MNTTEFFTHNLLPVAISLMVLWLAYRLLFTNSNRFQFNRFYLLTAMLFSLALPLFGLLMGQSSPHVVALKRNLFNGFLLNEITVSYGDTTVTTLPEMVISGPAQMHVTVWQVLIAIYLMGVAVMSMLFLFKMGKLVVMIIHSPKRKMDGYTMVFTHKEHGPYSFFRYAFFTDEQVDPTIVRHELSHIAHHHSWDILMVELMKIFQWFNPFIYFYKRELQSLHEYIADDDVVANGADKRNYMMLILQQCTAVDFSDMSNNFSLILTKKRIKMITKHEKAKGFWWKLLATLPVLALLLIINARATAQQVKKTDQTVYEIDIKEITNVKIKNVDNDSIYNIVEVMPEFPGGMEKMMNYLSGNIKYPEEAKDKGISGRVFLSFVIEKDGSVNEVKVMRSVDPLLDNEAVRVVKAMPKWKPGMQKGKAVRVSYVLPISFKLDESATTTQKTDAEIYDTPETMPEYVGGMDAMTSICKRISLCLRNT
ncbi:MAG: TonB family protein [Bacteroidales bacterium]|nr:TonB family protein [Bacteroidales bacterium]